jgi:hypothetical protein
VDKSGDAAKQVITGFGNVLTQSWLIYEINPRWAVAAGAQVIAPTATNGVASDAWEEVTGAVVRVMLPELSEGSYFAPQVRYGVDFGGNDEGPLLRQLRLMPTLNINLPHDLFLTFYPSPDIRWNYGTPVHGRTGRFFLPLNFMIGWKPTEHTVIRRNSAFRSLKNFPCIHSRLKSGSATCFDSRSSCFSSLATAAQTADQLLAVRFYGRHYVLIATQ